MKRQSFARFLSMVGRYWPVLALAYLFTFADKVVDSVVLSSVIRTIADGAFAQDVAIVKRAAYYLALVGLARAVFSASAKYLVSVAGGRAALTMRSLILRTSLNAAEVAASSEGTGKTVSVMINDIETARQGYAAAMNFTGQLFIIATTITTLFVWSWPMAIATIACALVCLGVGLAFAGPLRRAGGAYQGSLASVADMAANLLAGMAVVRSLQAEKAMSRKFDQKAGDHFAVAERRGTLLGLQVLAMNLAPWVSLATLIAVSGALSFRGDITPGTAVGLVQLSTRALFPFASIGSMWAGLQANLAAFDKVCQAMEIPQEEGADARGFDVADSAPSPIAALPPEVSFENVSFRYEDKKVLDSVSFQIPPGRKAALIGPSGSGKSTILNVLLGLYGYQDGSVRVDDRELRSLPVNALRRMISFVPQDPWLFPGTIRENIALGNRDAALENVIRAATLANAHDFIVKLPNGYDTVLDERGSNLSGGEKQRICLARAFLKGGSLLLLDEPTSSVDGESEKLIVQALNSYCPGRTVVMVSHNAEMCADADIVLQLEDGRLASATPVASAE